MKLYIAVQGVDYEGGYILGVFSSKQLAEDRIQEEKDLIEYADSWYVVEADLDGAFPNGKVSV